MLWESFVAYNMDGRVQLHKLRDINRQINGILYQPVGEKKGGQVAGEAEQLAELVRCPNCHLCQTEIYRLKQ